jgi:integrase
MANLPKGLYQRGNIFWTKVYQHGRPIYQSTGTSNLTEAKRILDVRRGAAQRGESVLPRVDRVRWEEAQADLIAYYEATGKRDVAEAKVRTAHLGLYFAGWRIARIDTPAIHGYVVHRKQQKAAPATINRELATLSKGLRVAHQNKKLTSQAPRIEKLQEDNIRQGFFEREQFEAVRKHLPAYAQPVVTFMYMTGWRIRSEALPLQWRQVDFQAGTVRLEPGTTKNKDGRTFYLTPELRACLEAQRAATEALQRQTGRIIPWVFHREGAPIKSF